MTSYPRLFSPLTIGSLTVRNRIMQTAHSKHFAHGGMDTDRDLHYHVARARGGVGLMITGNRFVHPSSSVAASAFPRGYIKEGISRDRRMTDAIHEHGAAIFAQLNHGGVNGSADAPNDLRALFAPSEVRSPMFGEAAKAMELEDIEEVAAWWARSAEYAREGGFDGVEIHLAHSYLLGQFLSPLYNRRDDEFGGSLENRLRFALMVIDEVRRQVGDDYVVGARITLDDYVEGGLTVEDAVQVARALENTGKIDFIDVSASGYHEGLAHAFGTADVPDGWLVEKTEKVKRAVSRVPVFVVGGLKDAAWAERILEEGGADMVAMTRALIADSQFPNKAREGREREIYHCIRANQGCVSRTWRGLPMGCTVNPMTGREQVLGRIEPAVSPGRWLVVGGGPAGMKAAEVLAGRGHRVTIHEQSDRLGGQINLIVKAPGRESFGWIVRDLETHMEMAGVEVHLNTATTAEMIGALRPDGVILATGALPDRRGISPVAPLVERLPGAKQDNVFTVWDALEDPGRIGRRVVVLDDDGSRYAAGAAEYLLDQGKEVEVITRWNALFPHTSHTLDMGLLYGRVFKKGLSYRANMWARFFEGRTLTIYNLYTGEESRVEGVDSLVLATGPRANDDLYLQLKGRVENLHRIGDCVVPRKVDHAIFEGFMAGLERFGTDRYILENELTGS